MSENYERFSSSLGREPRPTDHEHASRSDVAKDRDRIIHCGAFRRLQRKSQIVGVQSADFFRTRLTHTLECAQIARGIGLRALNTEGLEDVVDDPAHLPDLVEAAALAHDLGHPPFGHNGEVAIGEMMAAHARGMFEGNAQSFRIVTNLEPKVFVEGDGGRACGLDLTRTTLKAILKYPWDEEFAFAEGRKKFCIYNDNEDRAVFEWLFDGQDPHRTLATDILEIADDIAYAVHDFEDGVWSGMVPLYRLLDENDSAARENLKRKVLERDKDYGRFAGVHVEDELEALIGYLGLRDAGHSWAHVPFDRGRTARASLKNLCASLIGDFIGAVVTEDDVFVEMPDEPRRRLDLLMAMAWVWMIDDPGQETFRFGQRRLVRDLFQGYWENPAMLPKRDPWRAVEDKGPTNNDYKQAGKDRDEVKPEALEVWAAKARLICDQVAGMTDLYALHVHGEMFTGGGSSGLRDL